MNKLNRFEETVQQIDGIHKSAAEIRASPRATRHPAHAAAAAAPPVVQAAPEPEPYTSPPQSSANIRQPQQYRAPGSSPLTSPHSRSAASNASSSQSRKAPTPNAYGQTMGGSPKGQTNGYGLREYNPSTGPAAGLRVTTEPSAAQLTRHQSQQWQNGTHSGSSNGQHAPLERTASLNRIPVNDRSSPKPLVSTLMSRPLK